METPVMHQRCAFVVMVVVWVGFGARPARAQSATYHLHKEASKTAGLLQLKTAAPDARIAAINSVDLRKLFAGDYVVKAFDTAAGVPNAAGTIPAGSLVTFTLWMKKSANAATLYPRAKIALNSQNGAPLCTATGTTALTTTIAPHALSCTTTAGVAMSATDRFYLWVGVQMTTAPANTSVKAQLSIEGALNGNYDSRIVVPLPTLRPSIDSVSPAAAPVGAAVTIAGTNFGAPGGGSTVTFNSVAATASTWTASTIVATVPAGATTGPIVVSVNGLASISLPFTVVTDGSVVGLVSRAADGAPVPGAAVDLLRDDVRVAESVTAVDGHYTLGPVADATYAIRVSAEDLAPAARSGVAVVAGTVRTEDFALLSLGSITGRITESATGAPLGGAAVTVSGPSVTRAAVSDAAGAYTVTSLPAGPYAVSVRVDGYRRASASEVTVVDASVTSRNFALDRGTVTYAYDELDRVIAVVDPNGDSAAYRYDAAGNILSIARYDAETLSVFGFSPAGGPAGTTVSIAGNGFGADAGGVSVRFNGVEAGVVSIGDTQIVAIVPPAAATGLIVVTKGASAATSSKAFVIQAAGAAPAITGFSPPIASGPLIVTGANFDDTPGFTRVSENSSSMRAISVRPDVIETTLSADASSGHVEVRTPAGTAVSDGILFVPPPFHLPEDVGLTASMRIGESMPVAASTSTAALIAFDASAGQRVAVRHAVNSSKQVIGPRGRDLGYFWHLLPGLTLPADGTYTIVEYACTWECATAADLELLAVAPDITGSIAADDRPFVFDLTTIGQRARLTFTARAGQHLMVTMVEGSYVWASLTDANGFNVTGREEFLAENSPFEIMPREGGTYSLLLDPQRDFEGGHFSIVLHDILDVAVSVEIDGPAVTATTSTADQNVYASFAATAGDRIAVVFSDVTLPYGSWVTLRGPDGRSVLEEYVETGPEPRGGTIEYDVSATGLHTLVIDIDPWGTGGSLTVQLFTRPPDVSASIVIGGPPVTVEMQRWQKTLVSFTGTAGQVVLVRLSDATLATPVVVKTPEGYSWASAVTDPAGPVWLEGPLPTDGTYTLVVDPVENDVGAVTLSITTP